MQAPVKVALTGDVALEMVSACFADAGFRVCPQDAPLDAERPDFVYDVTSHERVLAGESEGFYDKRLQALAGCRYSLAGMRAIADEFAWEVERASSGGVRKVLAVDADNTLWRGTLSEDGPDALAPFREFQAGLKKLREDGVVLVLLSKNDPFDAERPPPADMGLFAFAGVNWEPKAENLAEACRRLNLAADSVVFVDDNPCERAEMKARLPEVAVAPWNGFGNAPSTALAERQLVRRLREYFFPEAGRTAEDRLRADDYARRAAGLRDASFASHGEYLASLGLWVKPGVASADDLDRLAQMAAKTNQFNATTIRRGRADFERLMADTDRFRVFVFRAGDRFGEQGLVCYVVADLAGKRITDFVMSCRAMGRTLEHFALLHVERALGCRPEIDFVPSPRNRPFAEFLAAAGGPLKTYFKETA